MAMVSVTVGKRHVIMAAILGERTGFVNGQENLALGEAF